MMKHIKNIFHVAAALLFTQVLFSGCQELEIDSYQDDPAVYFLYESTQNGQKDFIRQSFFGKHSSVTKDTLTVYVRLSGVGHDYDRSFAVRQSNAGEEGAAIEGVHFVALDNEAVKNSMIIKANEFKAALKIIVLKYENEDDPENSLDLNTKELKLELVENEYFRLGMAPARHKFNITMTSLAAKPSSWNSKWAAYFGATWGPVKFQFIIDHTGFTDWDDSDASPLFCQWMKEQVNKAFYDYNQNYPNDPLREANKDLVVF